MGLASVVRRMVQEQETRSGGKEALAAFLGQRGTCSGLVVSGSAPLTPAPFSSLDTNPTPTYQNSTDADGHTITHWAAKRGDFALVKFLASKGAPLFEASGDAVSKGRTEGRTRTRTDPCLSVRSIECAVAWMRPMGG